MRKLRPDLADVVGPLQEAETYARLQGIRQLGLYNVLTGLPGFLFIFPWWIPFVLFSQQERASVGYANLWLQAFVWIAFILACFPKIFLPLVRRYRPDWQSPLLESSLLKRGLEKQFWFQFPFWMAYAFVMPFILVLFFLTSWETPGAVHDAIDRAALVSFLFGFVVHVGAMVVLAWQSGRAGDAALRWAFLAMMPLAAAPVLSVVHIEQTPSLVGMALFAVSLVVPPILVGLVRLLGPRRWLVR